MRSLEQVVAANPYPDFADWWPMGDQFLLFMAHAIGSQWRALAGAAITMAHVQRDVHNYIQLVYQRTARPTLVIDFLHPCGPKTIQSGEFDALSYAFYKSAFGALNTSMVDPSIQQRKRHAFTQRVGKLFYEQVHAHLSLSLPEQLSNSDELLLLENAIAQVGKFLKQQGYLRDHFAFHFDVDLHHDGQQILQRRKDLILRLREGRCVYALYEMGYPVILPSAVYLYQTLGEAQHHSSRTMEELFGRIGCIASETADFDPTGYPSEMVVELWKIQTSPTSCRS